MLQILVGNCAGIIEYFLSALEWNSMLFQFQGFARVPFKPHRIAVYTYRIWALPYNAVLIQQAD